MVGRVRQAALGQRRASGTLLIVMISSLAGSAWAADWPQLQFDARHSGYIPETYGPPYKVLWWVDGASTPAAPPVSVRVQPVIAYGTVFVPSDDGSLYTYRTTNGRRGWRYATGAAIVNSAAVSTQTTTVYLGSTNGKLYALDAVSGGLKWSYQTGGRIRVAPVVADCKVFIAATDGVVHAFADSDTLQSQWTRSVETPVLETPAYDRATLYVGTLASKAFALNASDGSVRWQRQLKGQGFRDRWITAGNGKVFFNPVPYNGGTLTQADGTELLTPIYATPWSGQRQAILDHFAARPFYQASYVLDAGSGAETTPPILYTSGGSTSEHPQPVVLPNGKFDVLYRYTEGVGNPGCGATCICWSIFLGEYDPETNDIVNRDTWGSTTAERDLKKKTFHHTDESTALMRSGRIVYLGASRGIYGFDTASRAVIPFVTFDPSAGDIFDAERSPIAFYSKAKAVRLPNGWIAPYPGAEVNSDGNDFVRPVPVADGVFYFLHNSVLMAVSGTKR